MYSYTTCKLKSDHTWIHESTQFSLHVQQVSESKPRASNFENRNGLYWVFCCISCLVPFYYLYWVTQRFASLFFAYWSSQTKEVIYQIFMIAGVDIKVPGLTMAWPSLFNMGRLLDLTSALVLTEHRYTAARILLEMKAQCNIIVFQVP